MITTTLDAMAAGGIHDQLGGGFARYSTDETWLVPHFEKMLYDNALLTRAYLHGYLVTGEAAVPRGGRGHRRLRAPRPHRSRRAASTPPRTPTPKASKASSTSGRPAEIREVCGDDADEVIRYYGVTAERELRRSAHRASAAASCTSSNATSPSPTAVSRSRPALLERREPRVRPGPRRQGAAGLERAVPRRAHRSRGRARPRRLDGRGAHERRVPARASSATPTAASAARGARRTSRTPRTTRRCSKRCSRSPSSTTSRGSPTPRVVADDLLRLFLDAEARRVLHDRPRRRSRSSCGPKDVFDDATPSANALAANGLLRLARSPATSATPSRRSRSSRCSPGR